MTRNIKSDAPLTDAWFPHLLERVIESVTTKICRNNNIDVESEMFIQITKTVSDAATNTFCEGITLDEWEDAALRRARGASR